MASAGSTQAIIKRRQDELALMPPPPVKRIKRPAEVLDEDDYTQGLSDIIARDYYPGLQEAQAQEEYLNAIQSKDPDLIKHAEKALKRATGATPGNKARPTARDGGSEVSRPYKRANDTPRTNSGAETPITKSDSSFEDETEESHRHLDTTNMSLAGFQANFTSEDNESFNKVLDKQNLKSRQKVAHLWTADQKKLSQSLITQRTNQQALLEAKKQYEFENCQALIPLTTGATNDRSAKPVSWKTTDPANNLMFLPQSSIEDTNFVSIQEQKEAMSKAGPKQIVHENTRFPPSGPHWEADDDDDATSIHTSFIVRRTAGQDAGSTTGGETPRVNGYAFVDEDESLPTSTSRAPSYRDLLAGQAGGDSTPNSFKLKDNRSREELHHKLVERDAERKRLRQRSTIPEAKGQGNMTPAARRMMERLGGRTPIAGAKAERRRDDWTPVATPRRERIESKQ